MGYRSRLGKVTKSEKEKYAGKSYSEVSKTIEDDSAPYRPIWHEQLYELGKYVDYRKSTTPFYDFDIYKEAESEFYILSKDGLKEIIKDYHSKIRSYYYSLSELVKNGGVTDEGTSLESYFRSKIRTWSKEHNLLPYYLDQPIENSDGMITGSWSYEYAIFNLVYIYRTFDWENNYLIYSAW